MMTLLLNVQMQRQQNEASRQPAPAAQAPVQARSPMEMVAATPEATQLTAEQLKGVSRNAPCPCGSGKKFKHCHGAL